MPKVCSTAISELEEIKRVESVLGCRILFAAHDVITLVDADDYERLCGYFWHVSPSGYVVRNRTKVEKEADGRNGPVFLHRLVTGDPVGLEVDHISGFKLDNRKCNLRACTKA